MKAFSCGDVVPGCEAHWTVRTEDELFAAVQEHAASAHQITDISDELAATVRAAVVTVP